ncbi:uncharacterized protein AC631_01040 [Debaryomyces fabryi]|uniref:Gti1/Pac2 family protein n=1 Tax=Debaryomyces fabryi TaxID=58627 RepID=A0A0V1Q3U9_9ASCO|nr:uncharacterized protein AC631_01040 [Debaryomyces fabryi]KSA03143.1 hypothetical protein AC631_01040 [Debaryomyces fabryi]
MIIQAILDKQLELVHRRPHERERASLIKSGNVFVFIEEHSGIKRWTDGIAWSPSRILGRFLIYRELDKHSLGEKDDKKKKKRKVSVTQLEDSSSDGVNHLNPNPMGQMNPLSSDMVDGDYNKHLVGSLVTTYVFKDQGLIKKTLSLTTLSKELNISDKDEKQTIHLISYYNVDDVLNGKLQRPPDTNLKNLNITNNLWNAVKESLLGGKIPIEDEAYYFLDKNYQLQNMSLLQQPPLPPPPQLQPRAQSQLHQQFIPPKYNSSTSGANNNTLHMLPVPLQPPPSGHPQRHQHQPPQPHQHHQSHPPFLTNKDDYHYSSSLPPSNDFSFVNPFTSGNTSNTSNFQSNSNSASIPPTQSQPSVSGLPNNNSGPSGYNNYMLPQLQYSNFQHQVADSYQSNYPSNYSMYPHYLQHQQSQPQYLQQQTPQYRNSIGGEYPLSSNFNGYSAAGNMYPLRRQQKSNSTTTNNSVSNPGSFNMSSGTNSVSSNSNGWFTTNASNANSNYVPAPQNLLNQDLVDHPINIQPNPSVHNSDNSNQLFLTGSNFTSN